MAAPSADVRSTAPTRELHHSSHGTVSLPFLIAASLIIGAGVIVYTMFMLTFDLVYLSSVLFFLVGGLMLFSRHSGPDSSD